MNLKQMKLSLAVVINLLAALTFGYFCFIIEETSFYLSRMTNFIRYNSNRWKKERGRTRCPRKRKK